MSFFVPARLQETAASHGPDGLLWLESLQAHIADIEREWSLIAGRAFDADGSVSWVAPVRLLDGGEAVLKVGIPHAEARHEAAALRAFDGRGAVRLLRESEDGFSMLLERCVPGTNLWSLSEDEADARGASVLQQLWREPPPAAPFGSVAELAADWCESLPRTGPDQGYGPDLIDSAVELAGRLAASQPQTMLLHGDFHPANVLAAERAPWLAIDCKPVVGEPAYDLAQWLGNRCDAAQQAPDPVAALRRQIDRFGDALGLDPARIAGWAFVKSLGWDWEPAEARLLFEVMGGWRGAW